MVSRKSVHLMIVASILGFMESQHTELCSPQNSFILLETQYEVKLCYKFSVKGDFSYLSPHYDSLSVCGCEVRSLYSLSNKNDVEVSVVYSDLWLQGV